MAIGTFPSPLVQGDVPFSANVKVNDGASGVNFQYHGDLAAAGGTLFAVYEDDTAPASVEQVIFTRSFDGGLTWPGPDLPVSPAAASQWYPAVAADPSGTDVYVLWDPSVAPDILLLRSTDGGDTWPGPPVTINDTPSADFADLAVNETGRVFAAWENSTAVPAPPPATLHVASSADGITWDPSVRVDDASMVDWGVFPSLAVGPGGAVHILWTDLRNGDQDIFFSTSVDGGLTWTPDLLVSDGPSGNQWLPSLAVNATGTLYAAWTDDRTGDGEVRVSSSGDGGATWTPSVQVNPPSAGWQATHQGSIALSTNGSVHVAYGDPDPPGTNVVATSYNGGVTWPVLASTNIPVPGGFPPAWQRLASDVNGLHALWDDYLLEFDIYSASSADGGVTWTTPAVEVNGESGTVRDDRPDIAVDGNGALYAVWTDNREYPEDVRFARSADGGLTWTSPNVLVSDVFGPAAQRDARIGVDGSGTLYVVWEDYRVGGGDSDIYASSSLDGGDTWSPSIRVNSGGTGSAQGDPSLAVSPSGGLVVAWEDRRAGNWDIYAANSSDSGVTWSPDVRVDSDVGVSDQTDPDLAMDSFGTLYAVWKDRRNDAGDVFLATSATSGVSWATDVRVNSDALTVLQEFPSVAVDGGTVAVAWEDRRNGNIDVYLGTSGDGGVTWPGPDVRVHAEPGATSQRYPALAAMAGELHVAWSDSRNVGWDLLYSNSTDGGSTWLAPEIRVNDDAATAFQTLPAIAVGSGGLVHLVWEDYRNGSGDSDVYYAALATVPNTPPSITIAAPIGGESWSMSSLHDIAFTATDLEDPAADLLVDLGYTNDGGSSWFPIMAGLAGDASPFGWTTPTANCGTIQIRGRVVDTGGLVATDVSPALTLDCTRPLVLMTNPSDGAFNVPITLPIAITFTEAMDRVPTENSISITPAITIDSLLWSGGDTVLTLVHLAPFSAATMYIVSLNCTPPDVGQDVSDPGNLLENCPAPYVFSFVTAILVPFLGPSPPRNLTTAASGQDIALAWVAPLTGVADYYEIYRGDTPRGIDLITPWAVTAGSGTSYLDAGGASVTGESYYTVRAVNSSLAARSATSNTAGAFTVSLDSGWNAISVPLEPFTAMAVSDLFTDLAAVSVSYLDVGGTWREYPPAADAPILLGAGYLAQMATATLHTFTGSPAAMISYDGGFGFTAMGAVSLTATVSGGDVDLSWSAVPAADYYCIHRAPSRRGFHTGAYTAIGCTTPGDPGDTNYSDVGAASAAGEWYYLIVPVDGAGAFGSTTYSLGVWTAALGGARSFGLAVKPLQPMAVSDLADNVTHSLGVLWMASGAWIAHFAEMPPGTYDAPLAQAQGVEIDVRGATLFTLIGS